MSCLISFERCQSSCEEHGTSEHYKNIDVCETLMPPCPNLSRIGSTFDLDLSPTDLDIDRGHLLIKDYLPTKFEASWAKRSWVISCTRWSRLAWPLTLTFDLLIWISIGSIYSSRTIYLPSLKILGKAFLSYQLHKVKGDRHTDRRTDRRTDRQTDMCKAICPSFFEGGGINILSKVGFDPSTPASRLQVHRSHH